MPGIKDEIIKMLNQALALEHAARIQYLSHAEKLKGINAEPIVARIKEIADDEKDHEEKFRNMIGNYLGGQPSMDISGTDQAEKLDDILNVNLKKEKQGIDLYKNIYRKLVDNKSEFQYEFEALEHELRHIIIDEQEHVTELNLLLGI